MNGQRDRYLSNLKRAVLECSKTGKGVPVGTMPDRDVYILCGIVANSEGLELPHPSQADYEAGQVLALNTFHYIRVNDSKYHRGIVETFITRVKNNPGGKFFAHDNFLLYVIEVK